MYRIVLLIAAVLALSACSALRPMTLSEARGFCNTADGNGASGDDGSSTGSCRQQLEICAQFFDPLAVGSWNRQSCLDHCNQVHAAMYHEHAMDDCSMGVRRADELCEQYCRGNLPQ